jgi:hypothetical protein
MLSLRCVDARLGRKLQHGSTRSNPRVSAAEYPRDLESAACRVGLYSLPAPRFSTKQNSYSQSLYPLYIIICCMAMTTLVLDCSI